MTAYKPTELQEAAGETKMTKSSRIERNVQCTLFEFGKLFRVKSARTMST